MSAYKIFQHPLKQVKFQKVNVPRGSVTFTAMELNGEYFLVCMSPLEAVETDEKAVRMFETGEQILEAQIAEYRYVASFAVSAFGKIFHVFEMPCGPTATIQKLELSKQEESGEEKLGS